MIQEGDFALFKKGDTLKIFQVKIKKPIMIDRFKCRFDNLIGKPYGYKYEIQNLDFQLKNENEENEAETDDKNEASTLIERKDNRNLLDETKNQKLTKNDIEEMKEDMTGKEIIEKLVQNSASFDQKTVFSKEKYLKKKKDKYLPIFQVIKPTIRTLSDYYMAGPMKRRVLNMRVDTVAQMLTYSNVAAHRNVMVVESCKGLILSAIAERVGGHGKIINLSPNGADNTTKTSLDHMNFSEDITKIIHHFPLERADKLKEHIDDIKSKIELSENEDFKIRQTNKLNAVQIVSDTLLNREIDCFILASKYRPLTILKKLIDYMGFNRYFVIYSPVQDALLECHQYLKETQKAVHIELSNSWLREYQVIPERTHPKVMMDCSGGYILSGITVSNKL